MYELYYEKEAISKQLYEWLLKNGYADAMLIAKWKKTGYEKVCLFNPFLFALFGACDFLKVCRVGEACANSRVVVMLPPLRANERDQLQLHVYMSGSKGTDEGGPGC